MVHRFNEELSEVPPAVMSEGSRVADTTSLTKADSCERVRVVDKARILDGVRELAAVRSKRAEKA